MLNVETLRCQSQATSTLFLRVDCYVADRVIHCEYLRCSYDFREEPHLIDNDSGVGSQIAVADLNRDGVLDILTSTRKGTITFFGKHPHNPNQATASK